MRTLAPGVTMLPATRTTKSSPGPLAVPSALKRSVVAATNAINSSINSGFVGTAPRARGGQPGAVASQIVSHLHVGSRSSTA
jgi:hypothetical protein